MKKMKMLALGLALAIGASSLMATSFNSVDGSVILPGRQHVVLTRNPGNVSGIVEDYSAVVDLYAGQPVILVYNVYVTNTASTMPIGVSLSATLSDTSVIGVVAFPRGVTSCAAGTTVDVMTKGVNLVKVGANVTVGGLLVQSATVGLLTPSAAASLVTITGGVVVDSAVARVIETITGVSATGTLVRARIITH